MSLEVQIEKRLGDFLLKLDFKCEGELTAILGASGSGKSMTLKCIAGIEKPDKGRIILNGRVMFDSEQKINLPPQERKVGYLFQNYALFQNMTVEQNIACGIHEIKDKKVRDNVVADMIGKMQLEGLEKHRPSQLSGGQQQRVALARILVGHPEILMLDEPFSALDSYLHDQLVTEVKNILKGFDKDVLLVTHNRDEAYAMCSELILMDQGHVCGQGKLKEVFDNPRSVPGAILTGCKNIYKARKTGDTMVEITDLGMVMETDDYVRDELCAVGIRAHDLNPNTKKNAYPVVYEEVVESPFEWTIRFRYKTQMEDTPSLWWRISKNDKICHFPEMLGIEPEKLLLLYS